MMFLFVFLGVAHGGNGCEALLSSSSLEESREETTQGLMAYLGTLLEHQIIGDVELVRFIEGLEKGELINPISEEKAMESMVALIHRQGIQEEYLDLGQFNQKELLRWSKESLKEKKRVRVQREETRKETQDVYQKMEFFPVPPGHFLVDRGKAEVRLTHPIEVMSTPVTQKQWVEIMGENPSYHFKGEGATVVHWKGKSISMRVDHPVEQISWWSALVFANRLSEKHGLKPAYDLRGVKWAEGSRPEDGGLMQEEGEVKINENYYLSEGYRLPTEAEQEYLLRGGGKSREKYHFGDNEEDLKHYAWYGKNSNGITHPVGGLRPLIIEGKEFYDVHGNVSEWGMDFYEKGTLSGGDNPFHGGSGPLRVVRGGSLFYYAQFLNSSHRTYCISTCRGPGLGLRLVRTR